MHISTSGKAGIGVLIVVAVVLAWLVAASATYCFVLHLLDHSEPGFGAFAWPWTQWWNAIPWRNFRSHVTIAFYTGAINATILLAVPIAGFVQSKMGLWRNRALNPEQPLYGNSKFASTGDMKAGGIRKSKSPFG